MPQSHNMGSVKFRLKEESIEAEFGTLLFREGKLKKL